jgi:hypothetical protein
MPLHGSSEANSSAPIWAGALVKITPNTANRDALVANATGNAFVTGQTVGLFAVDANEIAADGGKIAHTGWVLKREGIGGRAGRIQTEVLVAGGITTDGEDTAYPDFLLTITTQPLANTAAAPAPATFRVVVSVTPVGGIVPSYQWQYANGLNVTANSIFTNSTTANLVISDSTGLNGISFKCVITANGAVTKTSTNAALTVT